MKYGRYEIEERLGEGVSAVVYRARDLAKGGRSVALKVLRRSAGPDAMRFRREFEALASLRHPNLVSVLEFGVAEDGALYYSSEHRPGQRSLRRLLDEGPLDLPRALELAVAVLRGLEYVHTRGLVHRDLKPENILVDAEGTPRLADFGLVGAAEGQVAGTPHYMAPEVIRGERVDRRADLYAFGVVLYELLTGRLPYEGADADEVARRHLEDRPRPPRELAPELTPALEAVVLRLLEKEPSDRQPSANAVIAELSAAVGCAFAFETSETKQAYVLSGRFVGRDREIDWLLEAFRRATESDGWARDPRAFDRRARFATARGPRAEAGNRRRGGDRRANSPDAEARANPPALLVLLRGASGLGKSRLTEELRRRCQLAGAVFLEGRCRKHLARGYEPFVSVLQQAARLGGGETGLEWAVTRLLESDEVPRGVERLRLVDALAEFLIARSAERPLVVCLEDLQWARGETLDLLLHLYRTLVSILAGAEGPEQRPQLFLLGTYRPEELHGPELGQALRGLARDRFFEELALGPLRADDVSELIRSMLGVPSVPRAFARRVTETTQGNPLFVELLMEELVDSGAVDRSRGLWRLDPARLAAVEIPARVHDLVERRLERCPERRLLEWLAVLDREAAPALLAQLCERDEEDLVAALEALCRSRLVARSEGTYRLAHSSVRDAIYAGIDRRAVLHARAASVLEALHGLGEDVNPCELAHHHLEAGTGLHAVRWARRAGESAAALGASARAGELYRRALRAADDHLALAPNEGARRRLLEEKLGLLRALVGLLGDDEHAAEARAYTLKGLEVARELGDAQAEVAALAHLGTLNARLKESDDAKRYFFEALKTAERIDYGKGIGASLLGLGDLTLEEGRLEEAQEYLERSLAFQRDLGDGREISAYLRGLANAHRRRGRSEEALACCERALEQDRESGNRASQVESLQLLADLHFLEGNYEQAIEAAEQAAATAELEDDKAARARCLLALGAAHERLGQQGEARRRFQDALALARRLGLTAELAQALNSLGWLHRLAGELGEALTAFNEATTLWNTGGDREGYALGLSNLGLCYGLTGELKRAAACYDAAVRVSWEIASKARELAAAQGRAWVLRLQGESGRARELLDKTALRAREQKQTRLEAEALAELARVLAGEGEGSRALRAVRRARALARELRDPTLTPQVTLRSAEVDLLRGALGPALDALRLRSAWLRDVADRILALEAELAFGVALTRLGDLEGAAQALDAARAEAGARGLRPLVARTRLAQGRLHIERALARGTYRPGAPLGAAAAELGEARAVLEAAREDADAVGAADTARLARIELARVDLLEGEEGATREALAALTPDGAPPPREATLLAAELALASSSEEVLVRAEDAEDGDPWRRIQAALVQAAAAERGGLRLEARRALEAGERAARELEEGLSAPDRELLERTPLLAALRAAGERSREEALARPQSASPAERVDRARVLGFLRAAREVGQQSTTDAQLRVILDRALALLGADRGFLVKIGPQGEQEIRRGRRAPGRPLPEEEWRTSRSLVEQVARSGDVLVLPDASADLEVGERPSVVDLGLRSVLAAPLRLRGRTVYVLVLEDRARADRFDEGDRELVEGYCELAAQALERSRLRAELDLRADELKARAREVERLQAALDEQVSAQERELDAVKAALEAREYELGVRSSYAELVGRSEPMRRVFRLLDKVAGSDVPVLVQGESGTGKELVSRAIHFNGPRREGPFLSINVAALPESLLEAELFGHVKGAFTGALEDKTGLFEAADGGTLFLDEVGDMPPAMQTKLLRVLQEGEVRPIGASAARRIDVRVVSASNKDLRALVEEGRFRADLYYRLNVVSVYLPPLRERKEDIPLLVDHLLDKIAERSGERRKSLDRKVVDHLLHHDWPGNVRELENELRRLVALSGARITERDLSPHLVRGRGARVEVSVAPAEGQTLKERLEEIERRMLVEALRTCGNNKTQTAKRLGLSRYGFLKKLDKYGLRDGKR
ncbi:MAG: GAF domain-containing protein [Planctomycetota bacterium]|nr:MAG: GAF domain-containing protein [Planctomycetota bacterium]